MINDLFLVLLQNLITLGNKNKSRFIVFFSH